MKKVYTNLLIVITLLLLFNCSSTSVVRSWKNPEVDSSEVKFNKIMVAALSKSETSRRLVEDKIAAKDARLVQSYKIFPDLNSTRSTEESREILEENDFDGVITMQLVEKVEDETWVPGQFRGGGYFGWHRRVWIQYYEPGYYREDEKYLVETNIYSLDENQGQIWSGVTSTINPTEMESTLEEILTTVRNRMIKDGLLTK